jgi:hypothetical protein
LHGFIEHQLNVRNTGSGPGVGLRDFGCAGIERVEVGSLYRVLQPVEAVTLVEEITIAMTPCSRIAVSFS